MMQQAGRTDWMRRRTNFIHTKCVRAQFVYNILAVTLRSVNIVVASLSVYTVLYSCIRCLAITETSKLCQHIYRLGLCHTQLHLLHCRSQACFEHLCGNLRMFSAAVPAVPRLRGERRQIQLRLPICGEKGGGKNGHGQRDGNGTLVTSGEKTIFATS